MNALDSRILVRDASRGDADAARQLLERYLPDLRDYIGRRAGRLVRTKESKGDLVQSVCREVLERLSTGRFQYRGEEQFRGWLYRAAIMKIMNRHRFYLAEKRDARREEAPPSRAGAPAVLEGGAAPEEERPSQRMILHEELERFERAFAALSEQQRRVITYAHVDGLGHREIAQELQVSPDYSRVLLSRALAKLGELCARL